MIAPILRGRSGRGPPPTRVAGTQRVVDFADDFARANGAPASVPGFPWRKHDDADPWGMEIAGGELIATVGAGCNPVYLDTILLHPLELTGKIIHSGLTEDVDWSVGASNARSSLNRQAAEVEYDFAGDRWRLVVHALAIGQSSSPTAWQAGKPTSGTVLKLITYFDPALWPGLWMVVRAEFGVLSVELPGDEHHAAYPFVAVNYGGAGPVGNYGLDDVTILGMLRSWIAP